MSTGVFLFKDFKLEYVLCFIFSVVLNMETFNFKVRFWYSLPYCWRLFRPLKVAWQNFCVLLSGPSCLLLLQSAVD